MSSEREKAKRWRLKWWHFRPSSPIIIGAVVGMFCLGMMSPPTVRPHAAMDNPYVNGLVAMLIGAVGGVVVGATIEIVFPPHYFDITTQPTTSKRWRPRFSLTTLVIVVTLVCCYAACWGPTKERGVNDTFRLASMQLGWGEWDEITEFAPLVFEASDANAIMPMVVGLTPLEPLRPKHRHYYFWFFGYVAKLPYERDIPMVLDPEDIEDDICLEP